MPYFELSSSQLEARFLAVAEGFAGAQTALDAESFVEPDAGGLFDKLYAEFHYTRLGRVVDDMKVFSRQMGQYCLIRARWRDGQKSFVYLYWLPGMTDPKVDWKATYGYGSMGWAPFMQVKPELPVTMRAELTMDNYYNYEFKDEKVWQCLYVTHNALERSLYAYIRRDHPDFALLQRVYKDKEESSMTVKLVFSTVAQDREMANQVEITSILSDTWFDR